MKLLRKDVSPLFKVSFRALPKKFFEEAIVCQIGGC